MKTLYAQIASSLQAMENCRKANNTHWLDRHTQTILDLVEQYMPSGSGIDCGTKFDFESSTPNRLVFTFQYHHMNENGMYDGWTDHKAVVTPSLAHSFDLTITGRDRNGIKDYLHEVFDVAVSTYAALADDNIETAKEALLKFNALVSTLPALENC